MFSIDELLQPGTINEAAEILKNYPGIVVLGGCGFLKMGSRQIEKAMDLSRCGLEKIQESENEIQLGAMTTQYDVELNPSLKQLFNGLLPRAIGNILGTQFRRCATIGASVYSKYGFSDILPSLLVLNVEVELIKNGRMSLPEFLEKPIVQDILTRVYIKKDQRHASYQNLRNASSDFPILNAAVSRLGSQWTIAVGARPGRAQIALEASRLLSEMPIEHMDANVIAQSVSQELTFGSNNKASSDYRRAMCAVLVKRAIREVLSCK
jgi:CO/xanthine dehydrogenase FAD-binding subunit